MRARKRTTRLLVASAVAALAFSLLAPMSATADEKIGTITVGAGPFGVVFSNDSTTAYVANGGEGTISIVDVGTLAETSKIDLSGPGLDATAIRGIDLSPDGTTLYAVAFNLSVLFIIDVATEAVLGQVLLSTGGYYDVTISPDGSQAWLADYIGNGVSIVDLATLTELQYFEINQGSYQVVFSLDGLKAYVPTQTNSPDSGFGNVNVIDIDPVTGDRTLGAPIVFPSFSGPTTMAISPDGTTAYVTTYGDGWVNKVNLATGAVEQKYLLEAGVFGIGINEQGSKLVVSNYDTGTVTIFNLIDDSVVTLPAAGTSPRNLIMSPSGDRAFITDSGADNLLVIGVNTVPTFTATTLPDPQSGVPYSATLQTTGFPDPTFTVTAGSLPDGLTLNPTTGEISGTPFGAGVHTFSITADNGIGTTVQEFTFTVAGVPPVITTTSLPDGTITAAYSSTIAATGDEAPTFAVTSGALPAGLSLNPTTGEVLGTPSAIGSSTFTVTATNPEGTDDQVLTIVIGGIPPALVTTTLPDGTVGTAYNETVVSIGNEAPTFAVTTGVLPDGLALDPITGVISGTPTAIGTFNFTITASNSAGADSRLFSISVGGVPPVITTTTLADGTFGTAYSETVAATGFEAPTFAVTAGALPAGLSLDATTGEISGTPSSLGTFNFTVTATNSEGSDDQVLSIAIAGIPPVITTTTLADGTFGSAYSETVVATGEEAPTFAVTAGALPAGLSLDATTGEISGTPSSLGTFSFTVTATNSEGSDDQALSIAIAGIPPVITTTTLADGTFGSAYSETAAATGEEAPTFAVTAGALPAGLSLDSTTGEISGTPTAIGTFSFTVTATNSEGSDDQALSLVIAGIPPVITTTTLPDGTLGFAYSQVVQSTGYEAPTFAVTAGALPAGLSLNAVTGEISGTPTSDGSFAFTVTATNSEGTDDQALTIDVIEIAPTLTTAALSAGTVGVPYSAALAVPGGSPATFAVTSGTLPAGLTLNPATGVISGTPTFVGVASFTVSATNGAGTDLQTFSLTIVVSPAALAATGSDSTPALGLGIAGLLLGLALVAGAAVRRRRSA